jgi:hypothetical protein
VAAGPGTHRRHPALGREDQMVLVPVGMVRWSLAGRPVRGFWEGSSGRSRCHRASVKSSAVMFEAEGVMEFEDTP